MAGTTRGAIKGWITRKRGGGKQTPALTDSDLVIQALDLGYKGKLPSKLTAQDKQKINSYLRSRTRTKPTIKRVPSVTKAPPAERNAVAVTVATSPGQEPQEGKTIGAQVTTAEKAAAIMLITKVVKERGKKQGGKFVYAMKKALLGSDGRGDYNVVLQEYGLTHLTPKQRLDLLVWMFENAEKGDLVGKSRRAGKGKSTGATNVVPKPKEPTRTVLPSGHVIHEGPGKGGLPDERRATQRRSVNPGRPSRPFVARGVKALGFATASSVKRLKLSQQDIVLTSGPKKPHADPTAESALRSTTGDIPFTDAGMTPGARTAIARRRRDSDAAHNATTAASQRASASPSTSKKPSPRKPRMKAKKKPATKPSPNKDKEGPVSKNITGTLLRSLTARKFKEDLHRRDSKGRFATKGTSAAKKIASAVAQSRGATLDAIFGEDKGSSKPAKPKKKKGNKLVAAADATVSALYSAEIKPEGSSTPDKKPHVKGAPKADVTPSETSVTPSPSKKVSTPKPKKEPKAKKTPPTLVVKPKDKPKILDAPEPEKPKSKAAKKKFAAEASIDELVNDPDSDAFVEIMKSLKSKDGRFTSQTKHSGNDEALSLSALVTDKTGETRFIKRTAFDGSDDAVAGEVYGDVHTDLAISEFFNTLGWESQVPIGLGGDPDSVEGASVVMQSVGDAHPGIKMERPKNGAKAVTEADWADRTEFVKMAIMDFITANSDRHQNNWMEYEDADGRHIAAIDHSMAGAAGARVHTLTGAVDSDGLDTGDLDMSDPVDVASTRSFGGFMLEGYQLSGNPDGNAASMEIPARVALLYDGDEEALLTDVQAALEAIKKANIEKSLAATKKKHKINDDTDGAVVIDDLEFIMSERLNTAMADPDAIVSSIMDAGFYLKRGGRTPKQHAAKRAEFAKTWRSA